MTTPAVNLIRRSFPQAHITYLIDEPYRDLVEGHALLDDVCVFPAGMKAGEFLRRIKPIRRKRYDLLIDFHGGPRAFWVTLLSGARHKIGYRIPYKRRFYHQTLPRNHDSGPVHSVENHINLIRLLGVEVEAIPRLDPAPPRNSDREHVNELLQKHLCEKDRYLVFHIGAGNRFRDWGKKHMRQALDLFLKVSDHKVFLVGGKEDRTRAEELRRGHEDRIISLADGLNLRELRLLIADAALFLGPDSGPMHIAASTSTPIVALFGPTLPAHFSPWQAQSLILEKDFPCRPCRQVRCPHGDIPCLRKINPEEVISACRKMLQNRQTD